MTPKDLAALHLRASASPWSAQSFEKQIAKSGSLLITHSHAFALGHIVLDEIELLQIATDPSHQRKGYGRKALSDFERSAIHRNCTRALLEVSANNASARALYTSSGWVRDGLRTNYYRLANGEREDAILMSKIL